MEYYEDISLIVFQYYFINLIYYWYHFILHQPWSGILYKYHYINHHKKDYPLKQLRKYEYLEMNNGEIIFGIPVSILLFITLYRIIIIYYLSYILFIINITSFI